MEKNQHNQPLPDGLKYKDEFWQSALTKLEAAEKVAARRRALRISFAITSLLVVISVSTFQLYQYYTTPTKGSEALVSLPENEIRRKESQSTTEEATTEITSAPNKITSEIPNVNSKVKKEKTTNSSSNSTNNKSKSLKSSSNTTSIESKGKSGYQSSKNASEKDNSKKTNSTFITAEVNEARTGESGSSSDKIYNNSENASQSIATNNSEEVNGIGIIDNVQMDASTNIKESNPTSSQISNPNYSSLSPIPLSLFHSPEPQLKDFFHLDAPEFNWTTSCYAGSNLLSAYNSTKNEFKIEPIFGIQVKRKLSERFSIALAGEYNFILQPLQTYSKNYISYSFGEEIQTVTVYTDRLHYLAIPFSLYYRISKPHMVYAQFSPSILITGENRIVTKEIDGSLSEEKSAGYVNGFQTFNYGIGLGYEYQLGKNKMIGAVGQFGLTDITRDSYFNSVRWDRNSRISLYLKFNLYSK